MDTTEVKPRGRGRPKKDPSLVITKPPKSPKVSKKEAKKSVESITPKETLTSSSTPAPESGKKRGRPKKEEGTLTEKPVKAAKIAKVVEIKEKKEKKEKKVSKAKKENS